MQKIKNVTFMNIGYIKNNDGEGSKYVTIKTNSRFFKHSRAYSNLLKLANVGEFYWSWILWTASTPEMEGKIYQRVFISTLSKQLRLRKYYAMIMQGRQNVPNTVLHMQNLFHSLNLLLFNVVLVAIPTVVAKATSFTECILYPKHLWIL